MGLFGKIFEKKVCDICGGEIGLLGNKKLEDGNCCKNCAGKLSPWFSERRSSTIEQIKEQLDYREENRAAVAAFQSTQTFGERIILHIDEFSGKFMVTKTRNLEDENPDVLDLTQVTGVDLDVDENRRELMREVRDRDGKMQKKSYVPKRFIYSYVFNLVIRVNHPYFDEIKFRLNDNSVDIEVIERSGFTHNGVGRTSEAYRYYEALSKEIKELLLKPRQDIREAAAAAAAPKQAVNCPYCGATTYPDASGCCEYCGASLNS